MRAWRIESKVVVTREALAQAARDCTPASYNNYIGPSPSIRDAHVRMTSSERSGEPTEFACTPTLNASACTCTHGTGPVGGGRTRSESWEEAHSDLISMWTCL